jgi:hypothetical protein
MKSLNMGILKQLVIVLMVFAGSSIFAADHVAKLSSPRGVTLAANEWYSKYFVGLEDMPKQLLAEYIYSLVMYKTAQYDFYRTFHEGLANEISNQIMNVKDGADDRQKVIDAFSTLVMLKGNVLFYLYNNLVLNDIKNKYFTFNGLNAIHGTPMNKFPDSLLKRLS